MIEKRIELIRKYVRAKYGRDITHVQANKLRICVDLIFKFKNEQDDLKKLGLFTSQRSVIADMISQNSKNSCFILGYEYGLMNLSDKQYERDHVYDSRSILDKCMAGSSWNEIVLIMINHMHIVYSHKSTNKDTGKGLIRFENKIFKSFNKSYKKNLVRENDELLDILSLTDS